VKAVFGRYLWVNLSAERITEKEIPERFYELHLGGRGLASRLLLEHVPPGTDPFSPQNALIFATGTFQGTGLAGAGRHVVMAISPKTRSIADSYVGGFLGHELGRSGYDGIFITGRASIPVYLLLYEGKAELREARDLWGNSRGMWKGNCGGGIRECGWPPSAQLGKSSSPRRASFTTATGLRAGLVLGPSWAQSSSRPSR